MVLSWTDLGVALAVNGGVAFAIFLIFNLSRCKPVLAKFYAPKRYLKIPFRCAHASGALGGTPVND